MRIRHLAVMAVLAAALLLGGAIQAKAAGTYIHFFVVPQQDANGKPLAAELAKMKTGLLQLAGGYTQLGPSEGGSMDSSGTIKQQENISYLVAADKDISKQLAELLKSGFGMKTPFILVWEGAWPGR